MSRQVRVEDAYEEACKALGESIVLQRLMGQEIERLTAEREATAEPDADSTQ